LKLNLILQQDIITSEMHSRGEAGTNHRFQHTVTISPSSGNAQRTSPSPHERGDARRPTESLPAARHCGLPERGRRLPSQLRGAQEPSGRAHSEQENKQSTFKGSRQNLGELKEG